MEVSSQSTNNLDSKEPGGVELIEQVVTLTGLPGSMVEKELHEILDLTGQNPASLTLDELRQAMLLYLEAIAQNHPEHEGFDGEFENETEALQASDGNPSQA